MKLSTLVWNTFPLALARIFPAKNTLWLSDDPPGDKVYTHLPRYADMKDQKARLMFRFRSGTLVMWTQKPVWVPQNLVFPSIYHDLTST
jgi:hypothetical protein